MTSHVCRSPLVHHTICVSRGVCYERVCGFRVLPCPIPVIRNIIYPFHTDVRPHLCRVKLGISSYGRPTVNVVSRIFTNCKARPPEMVQVALVATRVRLVAELLSASGKGAGIDSVGVGGRPASPPDSARAAGERCRGRERGVRRVVVYVFA